MKDISLSYPDNYDTENQRLVAYFVSQLDDQMNNLQKAVNGFTTEQLEWQLRPGMNTVGMLLAHLAVVEVFWILLAPKGVSAGTEGYNRVREIIGIGGDEDGLPLEGSGRHPDSLAGKSLDGYFAMLDTAHRKAREELRTWTDRQMDTFFSVEDYRFTYSWVLYHVLEHLAAHLGQVNLLKHIMRDEGVLQGSV